MMTEPAERQTEPAPFTPEQLAWLQGNFVTNVVVPHPEGIPASGLPAPPTLPSSESTVSSGMRQPDSGKHIGDRQSYLSKWVLGSGVARLYLSSTYRL